MFTLVRVAIGIALTLGGIVGGIAAMLGIGPGTGLVVILTGCALGSMIMPTMGRQAECVAP